jgi:hypothetical protein
LRLNQHIRAQGDVSAGGFTSCESGVLVKIQRQKPGGWKTVGSDTTSNNGSFSVHVDDRDGTYRAKAMKVVLGNGADICAADTSPSRNHND